MSIDSREIERRLARLEELVSKLMQEQAEPDKVIFTRERICRAYGFGKETFFWLLEKGAPIKQMGSRYFVHRDSLDAFFLELTRGKEPIPDEPPPKTGAGRKIEKG
jgi:hypothetical protein